MNVQPPHEIGGGRALESQQPPQPPSPTSQRSTTSYRTSAPTNTASADRKYEVDPDLVGRRVQLRYDPTDLTHILVFDNDQPAGIATPQQIRRHIDPKLRQQQPPEPGPATGVAYLDALLQRHAQQISGHLSYQPPQTNPPNPDTGPDADTAAGDRPADAQHAGDYNQPKAES